MFEISKYFHIFNVSSLYLVILFPQCLIYYTDLGDKVILSISNKLLINHNSSYDNLNYQKLLYGILLLILFQKSSPNIQDDYYIKDYIKILHMVIFSFGLNNLQLFLIYSKLFIIMIYLSMLNTFN